MQQTIERTRIRFSIRPRLTSGCSAEKVKEGIEGTHQINYLDYEALVVTLSNVFCVLYIEEKSYTDCVIIGIETVYATTEPIQPVVRKLTFMNLLSRCRRLGYALGALQISHQLYGALLYTTVECPHTVTHS